MYLLNGFNIIIIIFPIQIPILLPQKMADFQLLRLISRTRATPLYVATARTTEN